MCDAIERAADAASAFAGPRDPTAPEGPAMTGRILALQPRPEPEVEQERITLDLPLDIAGTGETADSWAAKLRQAAAELRQARAGEAHEAAILQSAPGRPGRPR